MAYLQAIPETMRGAVLNYGMPGMQLPSGSCPGHKRPGSLTPGIVLPVVMPKLMAWADRKAE